MLDTPTVVFKHTDLYAYEVLILLTAEKVYSREGILCTRPLSYTSSLNICYWTVSETSCKTRDIFDLTQ